MLTDEIVGRFLRFDTGHHAGKGLRAPAAHSNTHSNTHRPSSQPCEVERLGRSDAPCALSRRSAERWSGLRRDLLARGSGDGAAGLLDLTQTDLAEKTGIDQGDISRIGRGSIFPNEKTSFASPTPSERSGGWSSRRRPQSSFKAGVEQRKDRVSDGAREHVSTSLHGLALG